MKKIIMIALILSALMIGGKIIMNEESYAFCGSKCKHPVYTKDDYAVVSTTITTETSTHNLAGLVSIDYPSGFDKDNTFVISHTLKADYRQTKFVTTYGSSPDFMYTDTFNCRYYEDAIYLFGRLPSMDIGTEVTIELLLMKTN